MARKEKKYHFIYKTTNLLSGKYYIGAHSTDDLEDGYLGSGNRLRRSIKKHGKENFVREILEFCKSREALYNREEEIVNLDEIAKKDCMNLAVGGSGGSGPGLLGNKRFKELLKTDEVFRNDFSNKTKLIQLKRIECGEILFGGKSYDWVGKTHTTKHNDNISKAKKGNGKGEKNSQFGTCWITKDGLNKKIKKESLEFYLNDDWLRGKDKKKYYCGLCCGEKSRQSKYCSKCSNKLRVKVTPPLNDVLLEEVSKTSQSAVGRKYGVSHTTVQKWLNKIL